MSSASPVPASYPTRLRIAVAGVTFAWVLAAVFLFLGLRSGNRQESPAGRSAATTAMR